MRKWIVCLLVCGFCLGVTGCKDKRQEYGVYLSVDAAGLPKNLQCDTLVIDAQYFTQEEIEQLHQSNVRIFSYLNVGAIEDFRPYYDTYADLAIGTYENWPEEQFMDVTKERWQSFLLEDLAPTLQQKGIDGFFVDNLDVYGKGKSEEMYEGVTTVLRGLQETGLYILVNGADEYVTQCIQKGDEILFEGVNQETVYTAIDWEAGTFSNSELEDREYYLQYLQMVEEKGLDIYLIEYTNDISQKRKMEQIGKQKGYHVYCSDSIELD